MFSQHNDQKSAQLNTVCLPKLFVSQNCSVMKLQKSEITKLLSNLNTSDPNPKLCERIEVLKVRNELTKFGDNPSMFEPPTTFKTDQTNLRNLDRSTSSSSSPLLTWLWCSSVHSHPFTAVICLKRIYNFLCSMLAYAPFALRFVTLCGVFMRFLELTH
jgi:hypothetical protein